MFGSLMTGLFCHIKGEWVGDCCVESKSLCAIYFPAEGSLGKSSSFGIGARFKSSGASPVSVCLDGEGVGAMSTPVGSVVICSIGSVSLPSLACSSRPCSSVAILVLFPSPISVVCELSMAWVSTVASWVYLCSTGFGVACSGFFISLLLRLLFS
jgi:hypothetical protein